MKSLLKLSLALLLATMGTHIQAQESKAVATFYDLKAVASDGTVIDFKQFEDKVILIVNTASKCGFTPQFEGLEALYEKYRDRGLVILGFPCNQFREQDPGTDSEIEGFCRMNYGVTFTIMQKSDVNGENENPVFTWLKAKAPTEEYNGSKAKAMYKMLKSISTSVTKESDILWNFTKFLISRDGAQVLRFTPLTEPKALEKEINALL